MAEVMVIRAIIEPYWDRTVYRVYRSDGAGRSSRRAGDRTTCSRAGARATRAARGGARSTQDANPPLCNRGDTSSTGTVPRYRYSIDS